MSSRHLLDVARHAWQAAAQVANFYPEVACCRSPAALTTPTGGLPFRWKDGLVRTFAHESTLGDLGLRGQPTYDRNGVACRIPRFRHQLSLPSHQEQRSSRSAISGEGRSVWRGGTWGHWVQGCG